MLTQFRSQGSHSCSAKSHYIQPALQYPHFLESWKCYCVLCDYCDTILVVFSLFLAFLTIHLFYMYIKWSHYSILWWPYVLNDIHSLTRLGKRENRFKKKKTYRNLSHVSHVIWSLSAWVSIGYRENHVKEYIKRPHRRHAIVLHKSPCPGDHRDEPIYHTWALLASGSRGHSRLPLAHDTQHGKHLHYDGNLSSLRSTTWHVQQGAQWSRTKLTPAS